MNLMIPGLIFGVRMLLDSDGGNWMQLLVFVVIAVIYGLAGLAKSKAGRKWMDEKADPTENPPLQKPSRRTKGGIYKPQERQIASFQAVRPQKSGRKGAGYSDRLALNRKSQKGYRAMKNEINISPKSGGQDLMPVMPSVFPEFSGFDKISSQTINLKSAPDSAEILFNLHLAGPDDLKRAILYAEILGEPLAMRDLSRHPSAF